MTMFLTKNLIFKQISLPKADDLDYLQQDPNNSTGVANIDYQKIIQLTTTKL